MNDDQVKDLVTKLQPFFIGFTAHEKSLKNSGGMELFFNVNWKNKTTVSGLHAKKRYSIGCSFEKPIEAIFKDIRRRLFLDYYKDFFETKREKIERIEAEESSALRLKALASVIGGEISNNYGRSYSGNANYVNSEVVSIYPTYNGKYEFQLELSYFDAMKLAEYLKNSFAEISTSSSED